MSKYKIGIMNGVMERYTILSEEYKGYNILANKDHFVLSNNLYCRGINVYKGNVRSCTVKDIVFDDGSRRHAVDIVFRGHPPISLLLNDDYLEYFRLAAKRKVEKGFPLTYSLVVLFLGIGIIAFILYAYFVLSPGKLF